MSAGDNCTTSTHRSPILASQMEADTPNWLMAVRGAEEKKAEDIKVLDLREVTSFTDFFVICSVSNPRQGQAVCDEIHKSLKATGELPFSMEGNASAEWILMDYGDFLVHIFSASARAYYELERLWRHAKIVNLEPRLQSA
jgi:ribosome-associated protein